MRTLTDVFTPGAPTIGEGLRTLAVSPERELEPGMTVRACFTFRNQGGAPATGVRAKFNLPEGLVYLVGSGEIDGRSLDDEHGNSPLLARSGAEIGDLEPGAERRIEIAYSVAGAIENGSTVELQAAVAAFELPPVGSNVVRLVARSRPALENALTALSIEARANHARPGAEANVTLRVHNAGESSAHDVVAVVPIPEHTTYVANSARVNGREFERDLLAPFDRVHAPVIAGVLPASATVTLQYRVRIDEPLENGSPIQARAQIASEEVAAFGLESDALVVRAAADFEGERTRFELDPPQSLQPGSQVRLRLQIFNAGNCAARGVSAVFTLPESLIALRGTTLIDGAPGRERKKEPGAIDVGTIPAQAGAEVSACAVLASPLPDGLALRVGALLRWEAAEPAEGCERRFEETLLVQSLPQMESRGNALERSGSMVVRPGDDCEAVVRIANDGSAAATDAVLQLRVDPGFDELRVFERNAPVTPANDGVDLGSIEPYGTRRLVLRARVRTPFPDRSELRLSAVLHTQELPPKPLGEATWRVDSHPAFSSRSSGLSLAQDDVFRPNQLVDVFMRLRNEGTDVAQNVRARLYISPEARLEQVEGAVRERAALVFGEIAPGASAEARLSVRLLRSLARAHPVSIECVLSADAMLPVQLAPLAIVTAAEPNFAIGALQAHPPTADAGEAVDFVLHLRNSGDGPARRVRITVPPSDLLVYVPNSTVVNDVVVRDVGAVSPLCSERGLVLSEVDSGTEATVRWSEVVHGALTSGQSIARRARIEYDGERVDEIVAEPIAVRCSPILAGTISGLPFGVDGIAGAALGAAQRALPAGGDEVLELPPPLPVGSANGSNGSHESGSALLSLAAPVHAQAVSESEACIAFAVTFDRERLERGLRYLNDAKRGGLAWHLFAIRIFFPDVASMPQTDALSELRASLQDLLDRLFIKLRMSKYAMAARDVETAALRSQLESVLGKLQAEDVPAPIAGAVVLRGSADERELRALRDRLEVAPLGTALPWAILARMLPDDGEAMRAYRQLLVGALDELCDADEATFIDALQRRSVPVLDGALDIVRVRLANVPV